LGAARAHQPIGGKSTPVMLLAAIGTITGSGGQDRSGRPREAPRTGKSIAAAMPVGRNALVMALARRPAQLT
jgi:hypothetical protein